MYHWLVFANLLFLLLFGVTACSVYQPVEFRSIDHWSVSSVDHKTRLSARLTVYNPNNIRLKIVDYDFSVFIKDAYLGKLQIDTLPTIPSHSEYSGMVFIDVGLGSLLLVGSQLLKPSNNSTFQVQLKGKMTTRICGLKKHFDINTSQKIQINLQ